MQTVYAFDFDGTLTTKDTFFAFLLYSVGYVKFALYLLLLIPSVIAMLLHRISLQETKERLFARCFKGMTAQEFNTRCRAFAQANKSLLREGGLNCIQEASQKSPVLIVSASIKNYIVEFMDGHKVQVQATVPEIDSGGHLTGRFVGANCKGQEKVRRIQSLFPDRENYRLVAYGDSSGDSQMLAFADESHWKPFR
ncbi:MAG: haloacid dehalogenase-like hydrolase [Treponema sp.]|nr:haloacid dehalogenase-like hydrolase [Treponema sp.]